MKHWIRSSALLALLVTAAPADASDVFVVPDQFETVQAAVDVAAAGSTILVRPGTYAETVSLSAKGLTIIGDLGAVRLEGLQIVGLPSGQTVLLEGLELVPLTEGTDALSVLNSAGVIRVQLCQLEGSAGAEPAGAGGDGLDIDNAAMVWVQGGSVLGGVGADGDASAGAGGAAVRSRASEVVLHSPELRAGAGGRAQANGSVGGAGGPGALNINGRFNLLGATATGGDGGEGGSIGGAGGHAVLQQTGGALWTRGLSTTAGEGGAGDLGGSAGQSVLVEAGSQLTFPGAVRGLEIRSPLRESEQYSIDVTGEPGDLVFGWFSLLAGVTPLAGHQGVFQLAGPFLAKNVGLGTISPAGTLSVPLAVPADLGPGIDAVDIHVQIVISAGGPAILGPTITVTALDEQF